MHSEEEVRRKGEVRAAAWKRGAVWGGPGSEDFGEHKCRNHRADGAMAGGKAHELGSEGDMVRPHRRVHAREPGHQG